MAYFNLTECSSGGEGQDPAAAREAMRAMMGPQFVDQMVRQAITHCWMMLPDDRKTIPAVEAEIRRLVDRALRDLKEDAEAFGIAPKP